MLDDSVMGCASNNDAPRTGSGTTALTCESGRWSAVGPQEKSPRGVVASGHWEHPSPPGTTLGAVLRWPLVGGIESGLVVNSKQERIEQVGRAEQRPYHSETCEHRPGVKNPGERTCCSD